MNSESLDSYIKKDIIIVEKATIVDLVSVQRINQDSLEVYYTFIEFFSYLVDTSHRIFIIKKNKEICGYNLCHLYNKERFHIISYAIDAKYRKKGYGKELMMNSIDIIKIEFPSVRRITLYVMSSNKNAIEFYKKCGFIIKNIMKDYYGVGKSGFLMEHII
jgi:ribosomal protein S18 acetylase RimI-like enzyme